MIFRRYFSIVVIFMAFSLSCGCLVQAQERPLSPEGGTGIQAKKAAAGAKIMAVTAHPKATKAAYDV